MAILSYGVKLLVYGERACFTRPEMKAERYSYDVITPSAARGIVEAVYWHHGIEWVVDKITVLNEVRFASILRNELPDKIKMGNIKQAMKGDSVDLHQNMSRGHQQRLTVMLRDVSYIIDAHFNLNPEKINPTDTEGKVLDIFNINARRGRCYHQPWLGCREFSAHFRLIEEGETLPRSFYSDVPVRDLGRMLWDMKYEVINEATKHYKHTPIFFEAKMRYGVINVSEAVAA
ncbi:type I-C CRISPR-associated protein Cas5 [Synergistales bacterium]|nr:type I-C CRISPR-associated protein Cas5 [Synergistales bacterium]